jgi:hypothetical protein
MPLLPHVISQTIFDYAGPVKRAIERCEVVTNIAGKIQITWRLASFWQLDASGVNMTVGLILAHWRE